MLLCYFTNFSDTCSATLIFFSSKSCLLTINAHKGKHYITQFCVASLKRRLILVQALQLCPHFFHEHLKYVSTNYPEVEFIIGKRRAAAAQQQCLVGATSLLPGPRSKDNYSLLYWPYCCTFSTRNPFHPGSEFLYFVCCKPHSSQMVINNVHKH